MKLPAVPVSLVVVGVFWVLQFSGQGTHTLLSWRNPLSDLPGDVRESLIQHFDTGQDWRARHSGKVRIDSDIITDDPRHFYSGCGPFPGEAGILFVRAAMVEESWIVIYEYGGSGPGVGMVVVPPDAGAASHPWKRIELDHDPSLYDSDIQELIRELKKHRVESG